jgi:hypothetical protein
LVAGIIVVVAVAVPLLTFLLQVSSALATSKRTVNPNPNGERKSIFGWYFIVLVLTTFYMGIGVLVVVIAYVAGNAVFGESAALVTLVVVSIIRLVAWVIQVFV